MTTEQLEKLEVQRRPRDASASHQTGTSEFGDFMVNLVVNRERMSVSYLLNGNDIDIWEELEHEEMVSKVVTEITESDMDLDD